MSISSQERRGESVPLITEGIRHPGLLHLLVVVIQILDLYKSLIKRVSKEFTDEVFFLIVVETEDVQLPFMSASGVRDVKKSAP